MPPTSRAGGTKAGEATMEILYEEGLGPFLLVTVALGGGAAYNAGKAVAATWRPFLQLVFYMILLAAAARFIHFALFNGTLRSVHYYAVDFVIVMAIGFLGFRLARTRQMVGQYSWLYARTGPLSWRER